MTEGSSAPPKRKSEAAPSVAPAVIVAPVNLGCRETADVGRYCRSSVARVPRAGISIGVTFRDIG